MAAATLNLILPLLYLTTNFTTFPILHSYSLFVRVVLCSASGMFAASRVDSCQTRIRRSIFSLRSRLGVSCNNITQSVMNSDVYATSELHDRWITALYTIAR